MKNDLHLLNLKSKYSEKKTTEDLVIPLSENAWRLLAQLDELVGIPLPALLERMLEDAITCEWWPDWVDWTACSDSSLSRNASEKKVAGLLSGEFPS